MERTTPAPNQLSQWLNGSYRRFHPCDRQFDSKWWRFFSSCEKFRAAVGLQSALWMPSSWLWSQSLPPKWPPSHPNDHPNDHPMTTPITIARDPYRDLQKVLIGVFGFCLFAPKIRPIRGLRSTPRLGDLPRLGSLSGIYSGSWLVPPFLA